MYLRMYLCYYLSMSDIKRILIIGGGFGGIRCALDLAKKNIPNTKITLVSDKSHFEYTPSLYKVVTGRSPLEVCVQLSDIFEKTKVDFLTDEIIKIDPTQKEVFGKSGSHYKYDFLVLALGSETVYFDLPGIEEYSFGFKSINTALKLKKHIHQMFEVHHDSVNKEEIVSGLHMLIVGGGASGTELAGELALYAKGLAMKHNLDYSLVTIDIIESAPRLVASLPDKVSKKILARLHKLGVNVFLNRALEKEELQNVYMKDMTMKTKTVVWTAGIKTNHLYKEIPGIVIAKNSRVEIDEFLEAIGFRDIFIIGDAANTPYSGLAQTAIYDGKYVANLLYAKLSNKKTSFYRPKKVGYVLPIGHGWATAVIGPIIFSGRVAWWLRNIIDLHFFLSILPFKKSLHSFQDGKKSCDSCGTCAEYQE